MHKRLAVITLCLCSIAGCTLRPAEKADRSPSERFHEFRMQYDIDYRTEQSRGTAYEQPPFDSMHR